METAVTFSKLQWDTEFFGVSCAKAILHKPLTRVEWGDLKEGFNDYQFISIENRNSEITNAIFIGSETAAFLADVNVQFKKTIEAGCSRLANITIYQALERDERIVDMAGFPFSKFIEDTEFAKRGGKNVYRQWLINSFDKRDKFFAIAEGNNGQLGGYLLHSYSDKTCTIELINVSRKLVKCGIGSNLMGAVEYAASQRGCSELKVGTQVRNIRAMNFYQKCGCKQVGCHQVFHLWNL